MSAAGVDVGASRCRVDDDRAARSGVRGDVAVGASVAPDPVVGVVGEIAGTEEPASVATDQEHGVGPTATNASSYQPRSIITSTIASASAASVPGRTRSHGSALAASPVRRGSTTTSFAPRCSAARVAVACESRDSAGL